VVLLTVGSGAFANPSPLPGTENFVHLFPRIENRDTWGTRLAGSVQAERIPMVCSSTPLRAGLAVVHPAVLTSAKAHIV